MIKRALFVVFVMSFVCLIQGYAQKSDDFPLADNGIIDLRSCSFKNEIPLNGKWHFYWNKLLAPNDATQKGTLIDFPSKWTENIHGRA